ncbi:phage tail tape measure protein [Pseudomonas entomophila]|uniref:phage tail tape measure protein n=1 Tax=Pseudomonas entomophila TaxID=312306 RepID=UPI0015E31AA2|nr:phage tail tape measure protein [Pseudomonas entomophila]MBA1195001.1 phage tail tape measure protein [Pseudomonas entomophila]
MASRSLGTLTLDLIAKVGGFVAGMDAAERSSEKWRKSVEKNAKAAGAAVVAGATAAVTALTAFTVSAVNSTAAAAKEITNLSNLAGLSTTQFQKYAAAAATVGVEQDKLSDIFKDTNDKVGDFLATGGGELKNFFETIAPKVGVTAEQFRNLNSADALQLYVSSLQKANVNQAQMTFFMEAIADEASALVPLLSNGGKGFRELGDAAEATGMILDTQTIAAAQQFNTELTVLGQYVSAAKVQLAAEFMPVLAQMSKDLASGTKEAGGLRSAMSGLGDGLVSVAVFVANTIDVVRGAFNLTALALVGTFTTAMGYLQKLGAGANQILGFITFGDMSKDFKATADRFAVDATDSLDSARLAHSAMVEEFNKPLMGDRIREYIENAKKAAAALPTITPPGSGGPGFKGLTDAQKAAAKEAEAAAKRINKAFEATEEDLSRQIALINTTTDARKNATEVAKLQFDIESGKLVGINAQQQKRLEGLAAELDRLQKLKRANEDAAKAAAFASTLKSSNQTVRSGFEIELAGAGSGDKLKERLKADLTIQQDYQSQLADLQKQFNGGDISQELYSQETTLLQEALAERLVAQQDYYNQLDEAQANWMDGVTSAWENFADAATDYSAIAADATTSTLSSARSELGDFLSDVATGSQNAGDALMDMVAGFGKTLINTLSDMAAQWLIYQAVQLMVGKTTQSTAGMAMVANAQATAFQAQLAAFASTAAIPITGPELAPAAAAAAAVATAPMVAGVASTALMGMAHSGIDSIPQEGTWLLDGGERVLNPNQNRDLTAYLRKVDSVGADSTQRAGVTVNAQITVQAQPGMSDESARRQGEMMGEGLRQRIREVVNEEFAQGGTLWRR